MVNPQQPGRFQLCRDSTPPVGLDQERGRLCPTTATSNRDCRMSPVFLGGRGCPITVASGRRIDGGGRQSQNREGEYGCNYSPIKGLSGWNCAGRTTFPWHPFCYRVRWPRESRASEHLPARFVHDLGRSSGDRTSRSPGGAVWGRETGGWAAPATLARDDKT